MQCRSTIACAMLACLAGVSAHAQGGPPRDPAPPDPRMLPGDRTMVPDVNFIRRMNTPSPVKAPPEPGAATGGPTLQQALAVAQAAIAACKADGFNVAASVLDLGGHPRAAISADGSDGQHVYGAIRKALTALSFRMANSAVATRLVADPARLAELKPYMVALPGAVPLMKDGALYGAIGVSGAVSLQDEKCALAGAAALR